MTFSISAKIQDGSQNLVPKINAFLHFTKKFKMATKNGGSDFCEMLPVHSADTQWVKNFIKIALSQTFFKINVFLRFIQKFKMAAKNGGKAMFVKSRQQVRNFI